MRWLRILALCLTFPSAAASQSRPAWVHKGDVALPPAGAIHRQRLLDDGRTLLLVRAGAVQWVDLAGAKVTQSLSVGVPGPYGGDDWVISPDGRKMLVIRDHPSAGEAAAASVWDLQAGKRIARLDKTARPIRSGAWSRDGRVLFTYDHERFPGGPADRGQNLTLLATSKYEAEVTFWEGDTFARRGTLTAKNVTWWYLTDDGERFLFASGTPSSLMGIRYVAHRSDAVNVWHTRAGRFEPAIVIPEGYHLSNTRKMTVSPDGRLLAFVQKHRSKRALSKLTLWDIGDLKPVYEVNDPRISSSTLVFSPDGKYIALDAGDDVHTYETASGQKRFELPDADPPDFWLDDDRIVLVYDIDKLRAYSVAGGRKLYEQKLVWKTVAIRTYSYSTDMYGNPSENVEHETVDYTRVVPHPGGRWFMTYSNQYVKVFDARTGQLLQLVVSPPLVSTRKGPRPGPEPQVSAADWSGDGRTLYVIPHHERSVALWESPEP